VRRGAPLLFFLAPVIQIIHEKNLLLIATRETRNPEKQIPRYQTISRGMKMQNIRSENRLTICTPASPLVPILFALLFSLNFSLICPAAVIKVPENHSTIQSAIDAATNGDVL
jgi:hypothetical protein